MALLARTRATAGLARASRTSSKATRAVRAVFVRAEKNDEGMINFGGQQYTAAEWEAAKVSGALASTACGCSRLTTCRRLQAHATDVLCPPPACMGVW